MSIVASGKRKRKTTIAPQPERRVPFAWALVSNASKAADAPGWCPGLQWLELGGTEEDHFCIVEP